jgi:hypothetical protein
VRAVVLCMLLMLIPPASAQEPDDPPMVLIDQAQGLSVQGDLNLTGLFIDEDEPSSLGWRLFDGFTVVAAGDLNDSIEPALHASESSRSAWAWALNLDLSGHAPCACVVEVTGMDASGQSSVAWQIVFAADEATDLPPQVLVEGPLWTELLSGAMLIEGVALDDAEVAPTVQWAISADASVAIACMQPRIDPPATFTWTNVTNVLEDGQFEVPIDTSVYADGVYSLVVRAVDANGITSPSACVPIGLDNHPPIADISGLTAVDESLDTLVFDGSGSSDEYWGREELVFLWMLQDEGGNRWIESGRDLRTFEFPATDAGHYTLTLTVADDGGFSDTTSHAFNITNVGPTAALQIDSMRLEDGDQVVLSADQKWWLDCSESTDTANDQGGLECIWHLDGEPLMSGWTRQLERPADDSQTHELMLVVRDNDGRTDSITVTFGIQGTDSNPMSSASESSDLPVWAQLLFFAVMLSGLMAAGTLLSRRYTGASIPIPKWKKRASVMEGDAPIDQTEDIEDAFDDL